MNAQTRIVHSTIKEADVDLTAIMRREGIRRIEQVAGFFLVELNNARVGCSKSVGEALEKAKGPNAVSLT